MRWLFSLLVAVWIWGVQAAVPVIYLEQSHAGSFTFFTQTTDRTRDYRLLLVDAHPDSNAAVNSDAIRNGVLEVASLREQAQRLDQWRANGRIQCYNWLEPLMPRPISTVYWMPARELLRQKSTKELTEDAVAYLDGRLEIDPRECGSLSERWHTIARWEDLPQDQNLPWLASIDLDAFAYESDPEKALEECWLRVTGLHNLQAVSICLSRPWHRDDATAWRLWEKAIRLALQTHPARIQINGCLLPEKDTSRIATTLATEGKTVPHLDWTTAPNSLWALLAAHRQRFSHARPDATWSSLLKSHDKAVPRVGLANARASLDGTWSMDARSTHHLEALDIPEPSCRFLWYRLTPACDIANIKPADSVGASFAGQAGSCIVWKEELIAETEDPFLDNDTWRSGISMGRSWWKVVARAGTQVYESQPVTIAITEGEGFHAALSGQFGTPYMYGAGSVPYGGEFMAGTGLGNDCANMICFAWRKSGHRIPWCSPMELTRHMRCIGRLDQADARLVIPPEEQSLGVVIDARYHAAALWEDKPPRGSLGSEDIVIHHLSGFPELITLADFRQRYKRFPHSVWTLNSPPPGLNIALLGDVVPSGEDGRWGELCQAMKPYNLVIANVEGSISAPDSKSPTGRKFIFQAAPGQLASTLRKADVKVASLANNHAEDSGTGGLLQSIRELNEAGIQTVGAGTTAEEALAPAIVSIASHTIAIWGVAHEEALHPPVSSKIHLARLPEDSNALLRSLQSWQGKADMSIIMIHWGRENTDEYTDEQRQCSRWLASIGFDIIAGSHPHVLLPPESLGNTLVFPSLGNARMPNRGPTPAFNKRGWGFITTGNCQLRQFGIKHLEDK